MKKLSLILLLTVSFIAVYAQKRSEADALSIANRFLNERNRNVVAMNPVQPERVFVQLETGSVKRSKAQIEEAPAFYIYNKKDEAFVIVSGDERMPEVLAYSDINAFGEGDLPDNVKAWLAYYENAYNALEKGILKEETFSISKTSMAETVSPLLGNINYNQDAPYNDMCPEYDGSNCFTGCVATAIASIMKYYEYPTKGIGNNSYTTDTYKLNCSFDFGNTTFDWDNMLDTYDGSETTTQKNAVATLMKACGVAMNMDYTIYGSGAYSYLVPIRISQYFGYNPNMIYIERDYYQSSEWISLLKNELNENRPVYYNGASNSGGHAFVLDGYDKDNLFHVNWGWGGYCNGYFELLTLAPGGAGIGGGTDLDGYRFGQGMVLNFQPEDTEIPSYYLPCSYMESGKEEVSKGERFNLFVENMLNMHKEQTYQIGVLLENDSQTRVLVSNNFKLNSLEGWNKYEEYISIPTDCADGKYKLYFATKTDGSTEWTKVRPKSYNAGYLTVEVKGNNCKIYSDSSVMSDLSVDIVSDRDFSVGETGRFTITLRNNGNIGFYGKLYMLLLDENYENIISILNNDMYSVEAGESFTTSLDVDLKATDGNGNTMDIPVGNYKLLMAYEYGQYFGTLENGCDITISGESKIEAVESSLENNKVAIGDDVVLNATLRSVGGNFEGYYTGFLLNEDQTETIGYSSVTKINLNRNETKDITISYNTSGLTPGRYIFALGVSKDEVQGYYLVSGYYFTVLDESETDVKVSLVSLEPSYERGEDATLKARFETIGNGTYSNDLWAAICSINEEGDLNILTKTEKQSLEISAGETKDISFTLSTSGLDVGEYHYIVVLGNLIYLDTRITVVEQKYELDFSGLGITGLGVKAGENIGLAGILKNTGNGDFNGTCTLSIVGETVLAENTLNVSVPANSEYDLSQLYLDTSDVPTGTYYFDIVFKDGDENIFSGYEYLTVASGNDVDAYVWSGSLDKYQYSEGDKILFNGQAKAVGTGNYNGYYAAYIFDSNNNVVKNSNTIQIEIAEGQTEDISLNLSTFDMAPGRYVYIVYLTNSESYLIGKKKFDIEIKEGTPVSIVVSDASLSATEASLGDELTCTVKMTNNGNGRFDGYCAGSFIVDGYIKHTFGRKNVIIEGGEVSDIVIPVVIKDVKPGVYGFSFLVAHSLDEQYYAYYVCDVTVKDGEVAVGEIREINEPVVCSAPYEDNIRLISGVGIERISVYDYSGKTVYSSDFNGISGEIVIPGGNIRDGVYMIEIYGTDKSRYVLKAVRE